MRLLAFISGLLLLAAGACQKKEVAPEQPLARVTATLPFENDDIRLRVVGNSVPDYSLDLHFFDQTTGLVSTGDGKIYRTTDQGSSWTLVYSTPSSDVSLNQILFTSRTTGYVVGGKTSCNGNGCVPPGGLVLKTTDGGSTWAVTYRRANLEFVSLAVNATGSLFAAANGAESGIWRSNDTGATWTRTENVANSMSKVVFNGTSGFYTGGGSRIARSTDDGSSWPYAATLTYNYVNDMAFSGGTGYHLKGYGSTLRSTDNGTSWQEVLLASGPVYKINVLTATSCLIWGGGPYTGGDFGIYQGAVRQTKDGGQHWSDIELSGTYRITVANFYSTQEGYAVSGSKLISVTVK
jgi:photosystem II stability/assembly factor-like uncharacterized protein